MSDHGEKKDKDKNRRSALDLSGPIERLKSSRQRLPSPIIFVVMALFVWLLSGFYSIDPYEIGVVKRFGKNVRSTEPGLHYHLPYPLESVLKPEVLKIHRLEIGFSAAGIEAEPVSESDTDEAMMLTGDEKIVDLRFIVQYKIKDAKDYLFNITEPFKLIAYAAQSAMSEVVGRHKVDDALTGGKQEIQLEVMQSLQSILDNHKAGLQVMTVQLQAVHPPMQVRGAFKEVVSAREEKNKIINQAMEYANDIIPKAKGRAAQMEYQAEAYKGDRVKRAQGDSARFLSLLDEYNKAKDVTRNRLYLEAMEDVLGQAGKIVLNPDDPNIFPLLSLPGGDFPDQESPGQK